jgi:hypothetical protein
MELPEFNYHPEPLKTGSVVASDKACECCGEGRGFLYEGSIFGRRCVERLCPWCIADGSAAEKFEVDFYGLMSLFDAGVPEDAIREVKERTPGYTSWQDPDWLAHCGDACEFRGVAPAEEIHNLSGERFEAIAERTLLGPENLRLVCENYHPEGAALLWKFVCRHCGEVLYHFDAA